MVEKLTPKQLAMVLAGVPEKSFRITDLAPQLINAAGQVDVAKCIDRQGELNLAIAELQTYIHGVNDIRKALHYVGGKEIDRRGVYDYGYDAGYDEPDDEEGEE